MKTKGAEICDEELTIFMSGSDVFAVSCDKKLTHAIKTEFPRLNLLSHPLKGNKSLGVVAGFVLSFTGGQKKGAAARNRNLSSARRKEIAIKAARARWGK